MPAPVRRRLNPARALAALTTALAALLAGCALAPPQGPLNRPLPPGGAAPLQPGNDLATRSVVRGDRLLMLSFSGGGLRAAAFAAGVLQGLQALPQRDGRPLLDQVGFISSVSGGSLTAAWFRLHGPQRLPRIRDELLLRDGEHGLRLSLLNPANLVRLAAGALNDHGTLRHWLDDEVFERASFADLLTRDGPVVWINATNLRQGTAFPFHERSFDALCSDLASLSVADAVAASMAVPLVFEAVQLRSFPDDCRAPLPAWADAYGLAFGDTLLRRRLLEALQDYRNPAGARRVTLVDGGVGDNIGLTAIVQSRWLLDTPAAPLSEADARRLRRLLVLVVDAGQRSPGDDGAPPARSASDIALAALNTGIDANARLSFDAFVPFMAEWRDSIVRWRCAVAASQAGCDALQFDLTRVAFDDLPAADAARLRRIPTSLRLSAGEVDALLAAGQRAVRQNPAVQRLLAAP